MMALAVCAVLPATTVTARPEFVFIQAMWKMKQVSSWKTYES
jgi:hypothetical protein